jgi:hypothetical protein
MRFARRYGKRSMPLELSQRTRTARSCARLSENDIGPRVYPRNPRFPVWKLAKLGKILGKSVAATPNHDASVAAY